MCGSKIATINFPALFSSSACVSTGSDFLLFLAWAWFTILKLDAYVAVIIATNNYPALFSSAAVSSSGSDFLLFLAGAWY